MDSSKNNLDYCVYLLINSINNCTYIGITNNIKQRIRKHNGEIKGGARYTTCKKGLGEWKYYGFIYGLDKSNALSIEKKIHIHSKKEKGKTPLEKRLNYINKLISSNVYSNICFEYYVE